jgi:hypothetical protein
MSTKLKIPHIPEEERTPLVAPLLALAQGLRNQRVDDEEFYRRAAQLSLEIKAVVVEPALHQKAGQAYDLKFMTCRNCQVATQKFMN